MQVIGEVHADAFGNGNKGSPDQNVVMFGRGDGQVVINNNGAWGKLQFEVGISQSDVVLQADDAGDLTIMLRGDPADSILIQGDLCQNWGAHGRLGTLGFADGSSLDLTQNLAFTWTGDATHTVLTGSGWGANAFVLGAGSDQVTFGNGNRGGSNQNTVLFGRGDGRATVNPNGATGAVRLGVGITQSDLLFGTNGNNDLILTLPGTGDSLVVSGGITSSGSLVQSLTFADGTTLDQGRIRFLARTTTQLGTAGADTLFGNGDIVTFDGKGAPAGSQDYEQGNSGADTFVFNVGYGHLEVNEDAESYNNAATLKFGPGIAAAQLSVTIDSWGAVYLADGTAGDKSNSTVS